MRGEKLETKKNSNEFNMNDFLSNVLTIRKSCCARNTLFGNLFNKLLNQTEVGTPLLFLTSYQQTVPKKKSLECRPRGKYHLDNGK